MTTLLKNVPVSREWVSAPGPDTPIGYTEDGQEVSSACRSVPKAPDAVLDWIARFGALALLTVAFIVAIVVGVTVNWGQIISLFR
jgi:hypothetical protein